MSVICTTTGYSHEPLGHCYDLPDANRVCFHPEVLLMPTTVQLDLYTYIGLACVAMVLVCIGGAIAGYDRMRDWDKAYKRGKDEAWRAANLFFTQKIESGEITCHPVRGKKE